MSVSVRGATYERYFCVLLFKQLHHPREALRSQLIKEVQDGVTAAREEGIPRRKKMGKGKKMELVIKKEL